MNIRPGTIRLLVKTRQVFSWILTWLTPKRRQDVKVVGLCLLVAATFWFLNALNRDYSTRISYPIRFNYDDSNYIATQPLPTRVRLSVTGYGWNLLKKALSIDVEPIEYTIGKPLRTKYVTAPFLLTAVSEQMQGLRINYVVEDTLHLSFDRRIRRTLPVKVDSAQISLGKNYLIASTIRVTPTRVTYEGPYTLLAALKNPVYLPINTPDIDENYSEQLEVPNPDYALIKTNVSKVEVQFEVEPLVADSRLVPVRKVNFPGNKDSALFDRPVKVTYLVRERDALRVNPGDFSIIADFKNIRKEDSTIVLYIEKEPSFIRDLNLNHPFIRIKDGR